ncbi:TolC family protein [Desulforhopalus sp. 52FAK]
MSKKTLSVVIGCTSLLVACSPYSVPPKEDFRSSPVSISIAHQKSAAYSRLLEDCSREIEIQLMDYGSVYTQGEGLVTSESVKRQAMREILRASDNFQGFKPDNSEAFYESAQKSFNRVQLDTHHPFVLMDAVALAIQFNRDIQKSYMQYQQSLGNLDVTSGAFDPSITAEYSYTPSYLSSDGESVSETEASFYTVGVEKLSRFGLQTNAFFSLNGNQSDNLSNDSEVGKGQLGLTFTMPVLKQSGVVSVGAEEQANILLVEASVASIVNQINSTLNTVAGDYWNYVAAFQQLLLSIDAELRSGRILRDTKVLVENSFQANSDLSSLRANLANQLSARRVNEQKLIEARNQVAISIGFPVKMAKMLPAPTSRFAGLDIQTACSIRENEKKILDIAFENRQDLKAADLSVQQSQILQKKYKQDLLPGLNLIAGATQTGFTPNDTFGDMFDSPSDGEFAVNAGIQMAFPVYNQVALGQFRSQIGKTREQQLEYIAVKETITSDINNAVAALFNAVDVLQLSIYGEGQYMKATDDEIKKYKLGMSSIIDVLNTTDQLNAIRQNTVTAKFSLATAIASLRFGSATFFDDAVGGSTVSEAELMTPFPAVYLDNFTATEKCEPAMSD